MGCTHCSCQQVQFPLQTITFAYLCQALITVSYVKQVFLARKTRGGGGGEKSAVTHPSQWCDSSPKEPCWAGHQLPAAPCNSRHELGLLLGLFLGEWGAARARGSGWVLPSNRYAVKTHPRRTEIPAALRAGRVPRQTRSCAPLLTRLLHLLSKDAGKSWRRAHG